MPTDPSDNPIVNLLVKLERSKMERWRTLGIMAATKLLLDTRHKWNNKERQQLEEFKSGEAAPMYRGKYIAKKYGDWGGYAALRTEMSAADIVLSEEEFKESGETLEDWDARQARPFADYVDKRVKEKIDEDIGRPGRLVTFINRFFEDGDTRGGAIRRVLDRLVENGWVDEFFSDLRECYRIEAEQFGVPESAPAQPHPLLSTNAQAVYRILLDTPDWKPLLGRNILTLLDEQNICIEQSTLTRDIIPMLKHFGVENRPRLGYYIPQNKRPAKSP